MAFRKRLIRFKGKRNINWEEVEQYLKEYIGDCYEVVETSDQVYIGSDFPGELKGSEDTKRLYGANAKAKANATQGIPMLLQCATNRRWQENFKGKHNVDAKFGWYRFTTRFALPVYNNDTGDLERFNIPSLTLYKAKNSHNPNVYQGRGCFCIDMYYF